MTEPDELLTLALASLKGSPTELEGYSFVPVGGATQATVWRGTHHHAPRSSNTAADTLPDLALRLTPKAEQIIRRISILVDSVTSVTCPQTLAVEQIETNDRTWTVHLCTWIGTGAVGRAADMRSLGIHLGRLHEAMAEPPVDLTDRTLSFERSQRPDADQDLPAWYVARNIWRDRILAWLSVQSTQLPVQPIHGDLHWGNIVTTPAGYGFIDFDKVMFAPPVFDLAKLIATGMFQKGERVRFQARKATAFIEGYETVRALSDTELVALEGLAVVLNEETARLGEVYDVEAFRDSAEAVASWWIARRRRSKHDPLGIRSSRTPAPPETYPVQQVPLWPQDHDPDPN